jgi:hypothetical protein
MNAFIGRHFGRDVRAARLIYIRKSRKLNARCLSKCRQISVLRHTAATHKSDPDGIFLVSLFRLIHLHDAKEKPN